MNRDETVAGKVTAEETGPSQLKIEPTLVSRGESERKAQTANQLVQTSPVTMRSSVDRPIRTESTESVTDWANRKESNRIFTNPENRGREKHKDLAILSEHVTYK